MQHHNVGMQIDDLYETNAIQLEKLRVDLDKFVVPQMYYYLNDTQLFNYLKVNIKKTGLQVHHDFCNITSNDICRH
jgi:hypothetical protein